MADFMTRWIRGYHAHISTTLRVARVRLATGAYMLPTVPNSVAKWPSRDIICIAQSIDLQTLAGSIVYCDALLRNEEKAQSPEESDDHETKLLTIAHAGKAGHRDSEATFPTLQESFV